MTGKTKNKSKKLKNAAKTTDENLEKDDIDDVGEIELELQMRMKNIGKIKDENLNEETVDEAELKEGKKGKKKGKKKGGKKGKKKKPVQKSKYDLMREEQARKDELKRQKKEEAILKEKLRQEKLLRELEENEVRHDTLANTCEMLNQIYLDRRQREVAVREHDQWLNYLKCDGTPNVLDLRDMNMFIYRWQNESDPRSLESTVTKFEQVLELIGTLSDYIVNPINTPRYKLNMWKHIRHRLYQELFIKIDKITYNIIKDVRNNLQQMTTLTGRLCLQTDVVAIALHSKYHNVSPCVGETDDDIELPIIIEFPEIGVYVSVPYQLMYEKYVVRVLWSKFDDYSILCGTHEAITMPDTYRRDLFKYNVDQFLEKQRLRVEYDYEMEARKNKFKMLRHSKKTIINFYGEEGSEDEEEQEEEEMHEGDDVSSRLSTFTTDSKPDSDWDEVPEEEQISEEGDKEEATQKRKKKGKKGKGKKGKGKGKKQSVDKAKLERQLKEKAKQELIKKQKEELAQQPVLPTPSEIMLVKEEDNRKTLVAYLQQAVKSQRTILNLRKYRVIGGVYHVDFIEEVPQIKTLIDLSQIHVTFGEKAIKKIELNMNTNQVIKQVYDKYRDRFGEAKKTKDSKKGGNKKDKDDRKRIAKSLSRLSAEIERRLTVEKVQNDANKSKIDNEQTSDATTAKVEASESTRKTSIVSEGSKTSADSDQETQQTEQEVDEEEGVQTDVYVEPVEEDLNERKSVEGSEDSFKSHDSMFEEYIVETYDPINFKPKIKIQIPKHVLFFNKPFPVIWNFKKVAWYFNDARLIYDIEYEESEEGAVESVSFRYTKVEPPIALAVKRFGPLPYIKWELFPDTSKSPVENVAFHLTTELVTVEFDVQPFKICLKAIDIRLPNQNVHILDDEIGKYQKPIPLMRKMRRIGIDMFPDHDSFIYMEDLTPKHYICENHTYRCMAIACSSYSFLSSKWNKANRNIIMNIKEEIMCGHNYQFEHSLCLINTERAVFLDCTEDSETFDENIPEQPFCPDLYWLIQASSSTNTKERIKYVNNGLADTVYLMLCRTLILSFS